MVGTRHGIPSFDERLRGFGLNTAAWVTEAYLMGYQLEVLCDHFVVHMNHPGRGGDEIRGEIGSKRSDFGKRTYYNATICF